MALGTVASVRHGRRIAAAPAAALDAGACFAGPSHLLWPLLRLSGAHVAVEGPALRLGGYPQAATITPSPQHLALDFALLMVAGLIVSGASLRTLGRFAIACILWLPLRFALLMLVAMQTTCTDFYRSCRCVLTAALAW